MIKVLAINGSPRKDANTAVLVRRLLFALEAEGIDTELLQMSGQTLRGCLACYKCRENRNMRCSVETDLMNDYFAKMAEVQGLVLASPTYFADVTAEMKALIDRAGFISRANGHVFKGKVAAAVISARRSGAIHAFDTINHFFLDNHMVVVGAGHWNFGFTGTDGDIHEDREGLENLDDLGRNMAWVLKKLNA